MAKYQVKTIPMSGAFQSVIDRVTEQHLVSVETRRVGKAVEPVEVWEITTDCDISRSLDLSDGVISYNELCEICSGVLNSAYLETDTGCVCNQCQRDANDNIWETEEEVS